MFADIANLTVAAESRRSALLADAENFRLARLARRARRDPGGPPRSTPPRAPDDEAGGHAGTGRNNDAERRYAVSR